jgi:hypothetical protein
MVGWIPKLVVLIMIVALVLGGVILVHNLALDDLRSQQRYTMRFSDIDCTPLYGQNRVAFLDEVRYYASAPNDLSILDKDLAECLARYFGRHPWVEKVEAVEIIPPRTVRVKLIYRTPVLIVPWKDRRTKLPAGERVVDGHGILLPTNAPTDNLQRYPGYAPQSAGPEGTPWGDAAVLEAAAKAARH